MNMRNSNKPAPFADDHSTAAAARSLRVGKVFAGCVTVIMAVLIGRVVQLQIAPPQAIDTMTDSHQSHIIIPARRGNFYDRRGRSLAVTTTASRLFVDPLLIEDQNTFSETVGYTLGYDPASIERTIDARIDKRYIPLDHNLSKERKDKLAEFRIKGLATEQWLVREYAQGSLAAPIIGYVGRDGTGLAGLELALNDEIAGQPGTMKYLRDAGRRTLFVDEYSYQPHRDGRSIYLTLDMTVQRIAEQELAAACEYYQAESGMLMVMIPQTGEILAMANYPGFDIREFGKVDPAIRKNRCVTDAFEPGSIFKPFIWAVAIDGDYIDPEDRFDAHQGLYRTRIGRRLRDSHAYDELSFEETLIFSSNIVMGIAGERMKNPALFNVVKSFGFGESTNSKLPGEIGGLVHPLGKWTGYSTTSIPMGQEIGVTALQITRAFCAFANEGMLVTPTIQLPPPGDENAQSIRIYERVLSPHTANLTKDIMGRVVTEGTGRKVRSDLYDIFGKTGTAQIAREDGRGYEPNAYTASFIGGAPLENPRIVVGCFIRKPDRSIGHYGGTVSGPAVRNVIERTLVYMGVPVNNKDDGE